MWYCNMDFRLFLFSYVNSLALHPPTIESYLSPKKPIFMWWELEPKFENSRFYFSEPVKLAYLKYRLLSLSSVLVGPRISDCSKSDRALLSEQRGKFVFMLQFPLWNNFYASVHMARILSVDKCASILGCGCILLLNFSIEIRKAEENSAKSPNKSGINIDLAGIKKVPTNLFP